MSETKTEARPASPAPSNTPMVILDAQQYATRELAREIDEMRKSGKRLDEAQVPGGRFLNAGGAGYHDGHGLPVEEGGARSATRGAAADPAQRLRELDDERAKLLAQMEVQNAAAAHDARSDGDAADAGSGTASDAGETETKASGRGKATRSRTK